MNPRLLTHCNNTLKLDILRYTQCNCNLIKFILQEKPLKPVNLSYNLLAPILGSDTYVIVKYSQYMITPLRIQLYSVNISFSRTAVSDEEYMFLVEALIPYVAQNTSYQISEHNLNSIVDDIKYEHHLS